MSDTAVEAADLRKSFPSGDGTIEVLKGVSFSIPRGGFVSIMGPSGSGKSTLLNLIGLLDRPTAGEIRIAGTDTADLDANGRAMARREKLGFVFQSFNLMPRMTALQNVMLPMAIAGLPRAERRDRATQLLGKVGLGDRLEYRPNKLSGGQKQRVAIARALALDPPILLCDEPTGNLDSTTSIEVMRLFQGLNKEGRTIIQVTHDPEMAQYGKRILHFRDGRFEKAEATRNAPTTLLAQPAPAVATVPAGVEFSGSANVDPRAWRKDWARPAPRAQPLRNVLDNVPRNKGGAP